MAIGGRFTVSWPVGVVLVIESPGLKVRAKSLVSLSDVPLNYTTVQRLDEPFPLFQVSPRLHHDSANFLDAPAVAHDNPALATRISNGNSRAGQRRCAATNGGDDVDPGG